MADILHRKFYALIADPAAKNTFPASFEDAQPPVNPPGTGPSGSTVGPGTVNRLSKFLTASTIGDSQLFDNGTNVGIGTDTPTQKLDVNGQLRVRTINNLGTDPTNVIVTDALGVIHQRTISEMPYVRYDINTQPLDATQRLNARTNIKSLSTDTDDTRTGVLTQNGNMFIVDNANQDALRITQNLSAGRCLTLRKPGASGSDMVRYINNIDTTPETVYQFTDVGLAIYKFAPQFNNRSNGITRGVRRDELYLNYLETIGTDGILNNLAISEDTKLLILTEADELTGVVPSTTTNGRLLRIQSNGTTVIIRNDSASSTAANRFSIGSDLTINTGEIYSFIYSLSRWRRLL